MLPPMTRITRLGSVCGTKQQQNMSSLMSSQCARVIAGFAMLSNWLYGQTTARAPGLAYGALCADFTSTAMTWAWPESSSQACSAFSIQITCPG